MTRIKELPILCQSIWNFWTDKHKHTQDEGKEQGNYINIAVAMDGRLNGQMDRQTEYKKKNKACKRQNILIQMKTYLTAQREFLTIAFFYGTG